MSSWIVNIACLIAIFITFGIGPPEYESETRDKNATKTFWFLVANHLCMGYTKFHSLYWSDYFWDKQPAFMLLTVGMQIWICGYWLYNEDRQIPEGLTAA